MNSRISSVKSEPTQQNGGMNFIPIKYDIYPDEFHTYGMNSVSMTFILATVRSSYRGCEKTFVIYVTAH